MGTLAMTSRLALLVSFVLAAPATAHAADAVARVDFARDVKPILEASCTKCHGPDKQWGQLRLDARIPAMKGGLTGLAIVPGKSAESLLYQLLVSTDDEQRMPRKAGPLPKAQRLPCRKSPPNTGD